MNLRTMIASVVVLGLAAVSTSAADIQIIAYDTEGIGSGPPTPTATQVNAVGPAAGVTGINVTRGSDLLPVSASFALNSSGWNVVPDANANYQFGFTTTEAYVVDSLTVGLRSSGTGPGFMDLQYEKDGASSWTTLGAPIELVGTTYTDLHADLTSIGTVSSKLLFQLVVDPNMPTNANFNADPTAPSAIGASGTFRFASYTPPGTGEFLNPQITGAAIPEPSSIILIALGLPAIAVAMHGRFAGSRECSSVRGTNRSLS